MEFHHQSVLLEECIQALNIRPAGVYVDGTVGGAGHSVQIAARLTTGRLIALDKDPDAVRIARERLAQYPGAQVVQSDFACMTDVLDSLGIDRVDGILLDLGVSSHQLDTAERGFSYLQDAKLDMRMSQTGVSAYDVVNTYSADDLARILREFGEEKFAWKIAQNIVKAREQGLVETTLQLLEIVKRSVPAALKREGNPGKRTFQAIRIAVNGELDSLSAALDTAFDRLNPGGRFAVITFHSLEDRMVKQKFAALTKGCVCPPDFPVCVCGRKPQGKLTPRKPIEPSEAELERNRRSRSARLRVIEKL
ncbi:16S rRNA (cytosine(1402)-N(4))-methyltransferase RsmH [Clostridiaceae bacterium NSJ-31]|uniref:Ribosomal RNA small subunit methyltransferase H n=1 Tax=Ligaoa zhengdingensis TaxID=2763658 RepID=A0A926I489_9FIRM|nr:16S rRNA (cytosine(1402)-N(4))-methyltransferase RsmH [Ligaoa zhengdingensis]MBC8547144.1 16S rRNA (cytosine(1402)-N(4))-methyltransferase RsmH [Ligaoa zhengdingensis]